MSERIDPSSEKWARQQVAEYRRLYQNYERYAEVLEDVLKQAAKKLAPAAIIQTRPKSIASFAEKCQRKKGKYRNPIHQFTDLCGGRVIVHTPDQVASVSEFLTRHFLIDEENSIDVSQRLKPTEFGYRSVHYIVSFKPGIFPNKDVAVKVPPLLLSDKRFPNRRAEVQVRTILEHAWADTSHDLAFKSSFRIPAKWEREFAGVAAMLEAADKTLSRIKEGLSAYATSYGSYMSQDQLKDEIRLLEIVLEHDPENVSLAGRIGKLAINLGNWQQAIQVLSRYADSGDRSILKDLGVALCKKHKNKPDGRKYKQGQRYLEVACQPPGEDVDALASLAGTWKGTDEEKVRELYRRAFQLDPSDPYPLENYLDVEIAEARDVSIVSMLNPVIASAIQRCLDQAEVGVNLPWALYMAGKFYLLTDTPYKSLDGYAKAVQLSPTTWMVGTALTSLDRLKNVAGALTGHEWVRRLLLCGKAVIAERAAQVAREEGGGSGKSKAKTKQERGAIEKAQEAQEAAERVRELALNQGHPVKGPVVIVAGGCDPAIEQQMKSYRQLVLEAFRDYEGTVISGGTVEGICGLIGDVAEQYAESIQTIGYLPKFISADATKDRRYSETRITEGHGFSPLEPLQNWIDIIAAGLDVADVKVLGINGGQIAAIEYRIALALGATVGVVEESGREVARLQQDEKWVSSKRLVYLPADAMTIRAFVGSGRPKLESHLREALAKEIHSEYLRAKQDSLRSADPAMVEWEKLPDVLKESSAQQADHIFEKLRRIGCDVQTLTDRGAKPTGLSQEEVELLAEMEHGRWNAERLLEGWTWGEKKDIPGKRSPYLVRWVDLPETVKEWDRAMVRRIPEFLAKADMEIRRKG